MHPSVRDIIAFNQLEFSVGGEIAFGNCSFIHILTQIINIHRLYMFDC